MMHTHVRTPDPCLLQTPAEMDCAQRSRWHVLGESEARAVWNAHLHRFPDCSPFQSFEWGQYHKALGWEPLHLVARSAQGVTSMCLGLFQRFPLRTGFVWCAGGPVGDAAVWGDELRAAVREATGSRHLYVRFRCDRPRQEADCVILEQNGWVLPWHRLGADLSMTIDLRPEPSALRAMLKSKWRRNLRRAEEQSLFVKAELRPNLDEIHAVFAEMERMKKLPELFSREKLESLFRHTGAQLLFLRCENDRGETVAVRGTLIAGGNACDYLAATTAEGRRLRASYLLLWDMLCRCRERGAVTFDLGGIDPDENHGGYDFKRQTGAVPVQLLGEWDWATSPGLRLLVSALIRHRQSLKKLKASVRSGRSSASVSAMFSTGLVCLAD